MLSSGLASTVEEAGRPDGQTETDGWASSNVGLKSSVDFLFATSSSHYSPVAQSR
jgi:hypothetical protein